jgi:hypothetical protein
LASREKITWITCPDCGSKIGIVFSVGKATKVFHEESPQWPPEEEKGVREKLEEAGVDLSLVDVEETADMINVTPVEFLGDRWAPINDAIRELGGVWVRAGRESHWEISREEI